MAGTTKKRSKDTIRTEGITYNNMMGSTFYQRRESERPLDSSNMDPYNQSEKIGLRLKGNRITK